jgi:hypothetical protein
MRGFRFLLLCILSVCLAGADSAGLATRSLPYVQQENWAQTLHVARLARRNAAPASSDQVPSMWTWWAQFQDHFPVECDWALQDGGLDIAPWLEDGTDAHWDRRVITRALAGLIDAGPWSRDFAELCALAPGPDDPRWLALYMAIATQRRSERLATVQATAPRIVFTKRRTIRPSFFAYTEGQSDAQHERHFLPGSELCLLEWQEQAVTVRTLLADPAGVIRDPAVSWDGERVLFAWKKALDEDDYHLYELAMATGKVRQLTFGLGVADYEPAYLPNGDIVFASTRCVQTVDCWWTEVSNLYTCDPDGRFLRRLGFDQVHTVYPQVLDDGRVIYTRWDYNDRGQLFPQPLFQMNPDGTGQTEFYGNNSWFPTTIAHARGIPGTHKVMAILCGHHSSQAGKLAIIDPAQGRQENQGVQLIAPIRPTPAERIDAYGQSGDLWQYPYPLNERQFLVGYAPRGWTESGRHTDDAEFAIYWMDINGRRELLAHDRRWPCQQPVPLAPRNRPPVRPSLVDYRNDSGAYYVQDAHAGPALAGIPRGTVAKLRVIALQFRSSGIGSNHSYGPGGDAMVSTPVAIGNGTWDVKVVLGDTPVQPDGSAFLKVPARTPVYFQALDINGHAVQTMRSWSTVQPGETQSCVGCHESKNSAPPAHGYGGTVALRSGPQELMPFYGPPRGFSFPREIQPILDRHCVRCHDDRERRPDPVPLPHALVRDHDPARTVLLPSLKIAAASGPPKGMVATDDMGGTSTLSAFSLLGQTTLDPSAKRHWSDAYLNLTSARPANTASDHSSYAGLFDGQRVNWIGSQSIPAPLPAYAAGAARSGLFPMLVHGHYDVRLSREELDKLACWIDLLVPYCGDYTEANAWSESEWHTYRRYENKRQQMEQLDRLNVEAWQQAR